MRQQMQIVTRRTGSLVCWNLCTEEILERESSYNASQWDSIESVLSDQSGAVEVCNPEIGKNLLSSSGLPVIRPVPSKDIVE